MLQKISKNMLSWSFGVNLERLPGGFLVIIQFYKKVWGLIWGNYTNTDQVILALRLAGIPEDQIELVYL